MSQAGKLTEGSPTLLGIETITGDSGGAVPGTGIPVNVNLLGTAGQITVTGNPGTSTLTLSLAGGGTAIDSIGTQTGTNPITPTAGGLVTINGAVVAAGTNPVRSDGTGANTMAIEVQTSQAIASADATKIGLCNFSSTYFVVDANGFVTESLSKVVNYTAVTNAQTPYTVLSTDYYIAADVTAGVITLRLPDAPTTGRIFTIKDKIGNSAVSNITVTTVGGAVLIDGAATYTINTNYAAINLIFNSVSYEIN